MSSTSGTISSYVGSKWATVVVVAALAVAAITVPAVTGGSGAAAANVWVDTDGGTCTRQSTAGAYSDAGACSTLDAAYTAASAGDLVYVCGGGDSSTCLTGTTTYSNQNMDGPAKGSGAQMTIQEAPGATVTLTRLDIGGLSTPVDRVLIKNFTIVDTTRTCSPPGCLDGLNYVIDMSWTTNVDFDGISASSNYEGVTTLGISGAVTDTDITNSTFGETRDAKVISIQDSNSSSIAATNLTFDHLDIGDMGYGTNTGTPDIHVECIYFDGPMSGWTVTNTIFHECISTGALNWGGASAMTSVLFRNNVFGVKYGWENGVDIAPGAKVAYRGDTSSPIIDGDNNGGTGTLEYNVFHGAVKLDGWSSLTLRGNILNNSSCTSGVTYAYNVMATACGTGTTVSASIFTGTNFTNTAQGVHDYRPTSGSALQCGKGDTGSFPSTDLLGVTRASPPDAGPYEC